MRIAACLSAFLILTSACTSVPQPADSSLDAAFSEAARSYDVPRDLLVAIAWAQTRFDDRVTGPSIHQGYGIMDLPEGEVAFGPSLDRAAVALDMSPDALAGDRRLNILAAAAELRWEADRFEEESGLALDSVDDWFEVVGWYGGVDEGDAQRSFARQVYRVLEGGLLARGPEGEWLEVASRELDLPALDFEPLSSTGDSPLAAAYVQASSANYTNDSRGAGDIDMIVVHTAQGSYAGTYSWFQNSAAQATAHYVIRSSDGEITQMVREEDVAWHAGHWETNHRSIGVEMEGYIEAPGTWYTDAMYDSMAAIVVDISDRQGVPLDRDHIIGHSEVPGCSYSGGGGASCHTDPGTGWDFDRLMDLVIAKSGGSSSSGSTGSGSTTTPSASVGELVGFVRKDSIYNTSGPLVGATVALSSGQSATTDGNGYFQVEDVPTGMVDLSVSASGFDTTVVSKDVAANSLNWRSVALIASSSGSTSSGSTSSGSTSTASVPGLPVAMSPTGWQTVHGPSVTMSWTDTGAAATSYELKIWWYDGNDWQYYYAYTPTTPDKTFWPAVDDTYYAWSARGLNAQGAGEWSPLNYLYFSN